MKNQSLVFSCLSLMGSMLLSSESDVFPFAKNPELSFRQFEQDFRKTYAHLNIPEIILDNNCDFAPMYIWDPKDKDLTKFNEHRTDKKLPPFIIMNIKATRLVTAQQVEHVLLHEVGHHNYDRAQNEYNHARAKRIANNVNTGFNWAVPTLNLGLLYHNAYQISQKVLPKKALVAQALAVAMYSKMAGMKESIDTLCDDVIGTRPEEFAADDFANQHATQQTLQAGHDIYLKESFINRNHFDFVQDFENDKEMQAKDATTKDVALKIAQCLNSLQGFMLAGIYNVHGLFAPGHPSPSQRRYIVAQALKDRFGVEV